MKNIMLTLLISVEREPSYATTKFLKRSELVGTDFGIYKNLTKPCPHESNDDNSSRENFKIKVGDLTNKELVKEKVHTKRNEFLLDTYASIKTPKVEEELFVTFGTKTLEILDVGLGKDNGGIYFTPTDELYVEVSTKVEVSSEESLNTLKEKVNSYEEGVFVDSVIELPPEEK